MKWLWGIMAVLILLLQIRLWAGENSLIQAWDLHEQIEQQKEINAGLEARNAELFAEVNNLGDGSRAIEERARVNLGMIREDETFFLVVDP
jgi:cell division protein FtsB